MKRFILSYLCLCLLVGAHAQEKVTLSGRVTDEVTGEDLIGATLYIEELQTGAVTNVYGFYSITIPPGSYALRVSYIGFETRTERLNLIADRTWNLGLSGTAEQLEEVVVTGELLDANVRENEMSTISLSAKTIKDVPAVLGEPDVIKSMLLLPGVTSVGDGTSGFNVRGGAADQNLIQLDEGTIYNAAHVLGFFSTFNPDAVKDVKIYKGGIPAKFGGRLSSVLDVRQREGNSKAIAGAGAVSLISARALLEGPIVRDRASFMVAARRSYADAFLALIDNKNTAYFYDLNLKTNYALNEKNRLFLSGYFGRDRLALSGVSGNNWGNATGTLRWNSVLTPQLFANFSVIYSDYDYAVDNLVAGSEYRLQSNILNWNYKADLGYYINDRNDVEFGFDWKDHQFKSGNVSPIEGSRVRAFRLDDKYAIEQAAYASYNLKITKNLELAAGIRYSRFARQGRQNLPVYQDNLPVRYNTELHRYEPGEEVDVITYAANGLIKAYDNWEPRFSATYVINQAQSVKMSYNRMNQYVHLISNTTAPGPLDVWVPSGPFVKPQQADLFALGYFRNFGANTWEVSAEIYWKDISNMVDYVDGADIVANNRLETVLLNADGRSYGLEFLIRKNTGKLTGWLSYTLSRSERQVKGLGLGDTGINNGQYFKSNFDKPHDLSITAVYTLNSRWSVSGNFVFATGLPSTYPLGRYQYAGVLLPHYGFRNQERLPDYHRLDVSATLKGRSVNGRRKKGEWTFGLFNAYNRANANSIYFIENEEKRGETTAMKTYLYGVTPNVSYSFKF